MTDSYRARFSNGHVISGKDRRQAFSHAWHARGFHRIDKLPWSYHGFSCSAERAARNMACMTNFAPADHVSFAEVVAIEQLAAASAPAGPAEAAGV